MKLKQFNLEEWLQDKSRKVVTRDGRAVRIICWDKENTPSPIVFLIKDSEEGCSYEYINCANIEGKADIRLDDLFFAGEKEELEEEISNYIKDNFFGSVSMGFFSNRTNQELDSIDVVNIARHFAEWQKQQTVEKAVEWIQNNIARDFGFDEDLRACIPEFIGAFKQTMEE